MEHVIGDFFVVDGLVYQCREGYNCSRCACYYKEECECTDVSNEMGMCGASLRADGKDVYFVYVGMVDSPLVITKDMVR